MRNNFIIRVGLHPFPEDLKSIASMMGGEPQGNNHSKRWKYHRKYILNDYLPYAYSYMLQTWFLHFSIVALQGSQQLKNRVNASLSYAYTGFTSYCLLSGSIFSTLGFFNSLIKGVFSS